MPERDLTEIDGIGPARSDTFKSAGYETISDLKGASVSELAEIVPEHVAIDIKNQVGEIHINRPNAAQAAEQAEEMPEDAIVKTVRVNGRQRSKALRKIKEQNKGGATMEVYKG